MILYGGIDSGMDGAVALVDQYGKCVRMYDSFKIDVGKGKTKGGKKKVNNIPETYSMARAIRMCRAYARKRGHSLIFTLEKQQAMPKQGVVSMFKIGLSYGCWLGCLDSFKIKYELVHPRTWQTKILKDARGTDTKARSLNVGRRLFPDVPLPLKGDHNKSDALLIAEYTRRMDNGC